MLSQAKLVPKKILYNKTKILIVRLRSFSSVLICFLFSFSSKLSSVGIFSLRREIVVFVCLLLLLLFAASFYKFTSTSVAFPHFILSTYKNSQSFQKLMENVCQHRIWLTLNILHFNHFNHLRINLVLCGVQHAQNSTQW